MSAFCLKKKMTHIGSQGEQCSHCLPCLTNISLSLLCSASALSSLHPAWGFGFWLQGFLGAPMSMLLAQQNHRHSHHLLSLCWSSSAGTVIRGRSGAAATTAARWGKRRPGIVTMAANNYRNDVVLATKAVRLASRLCQVTFRIGFCV